jgi:hypothetical protein
MVYRSVRIPNPVFQCALPEPRRRALSVSSPIMPALGYYTNLHNTAFVILQRKGYRVWADGDMICAEKGGWDFMADDPVQLLGLISIYEALQPSDYREYWWKIDEPGLHGNIPEGPPDYVPVWQRG